MANLVPLYTWGVLQFEVYPFSLNEVDHTTATDWARKEIAGAAMYREWVGEGDEEIGMRGRLYPHFYAQHARNGTAPAKAATGGIAEIEMMDSMRRLGQAHALVRADGWHFGWFVIERLVKSHTFLAKDGIGQQIMFEASFVRVPVPLDPSSYFAGIWSQGGGSAAP